MSSDIKRTLFIAEVNGQHVLWKNFIGEACNKSDKIVQMGNIVSVFPSLRDGMKTPGAKKASTPNSASLRLIELYRATEENWVQLVGKNEIIALNKPADYTNRNTNKRLRRAWFSEDRWLQVAAVDKGRLVTHAGLTYGEWCSIGKPKTAAEAAEALQEKYEKTLFQGKSYTLGHKPNFAANPIWANSLVELYPSWVTADEEPPFGQVHTGEPMSSEFGVQQTKKDWGLLQYVDDVRYTRFGSLTTIGNQEFVCVHLGFPPKLTSVMPTRWSLYTERLKTS